MPDVPVPKPAKQGTGGGKLGAKSRAWADKITRPPSDLNRILNQRASRVLTDADCLPPIHFSFKHRQRDVFIYAVFMLFCNLAIPCILYYVLRDNTDLDANVLLGVGAASLGISSCFDHPFRTWKLWSHRDYYGPLGDDNKWHFDAFNHVYTIALLIFAFPLAIATSTEPVMEKFFLMSTPMLLAPVGIIYLLTLLPISVPFWVSSDPPHTKLKPGMYYITEDLGAVDFRHGRNFRTAMNKRYEASPLFRQLFKWLTLIWGLAFIIYVPCVAAIAWNTTFGFAYGFILGFFFFYFVICGLISWGMVNLYRKKERRWLHKIKAEAAAEGVEVATITPPGTARASPAPTDSTPMSSNGQIASLRQHQSQSASSASTSLPQHPAPAAQSGDSREVLT